MTQALLALGFVGAMAVSTPVTTKAQGIYFSGPGLGVEIGNRPDRYRYTRRYYRDYDNSYAYDRRFDERRYNNRNSCPPNYIIQDGRCKPYRGY